MTKQFLCLLLIALLLTPSLAMTQLTKKIPRLGFLVPGSSATFSARIEA